MLLLPLRQLIAFNDEFAEFFSDQTGVEDIDRSRCVYDFSSAAHCVRLADHEPEGWLLLRNKGHTHLLIEASHEKKEWRSWFAPDPKKVLESVRPSFESWPQLFPLIGKAEAEAHRGKDEKPNLAYLADLMTEALHVANPLSVITSQIKELTPKKPTGI
jgi:hypothetical protein